MTAEQFFQDLPTLQTERLILRALRESDAEDIFVYAQNPDVCRYTTWSPHESIANTRAFLAKVISNYEAGKAEMWGMVMKASGRVIGNCGFCKFLPEHERAEVGYALSREFWGQGLTTEALRAAIDCGFRSMALHKIEAHCDAPNVASARVMEKCGMRCEGVLREHVVLKRERRDVSMFGVLRTEWESGRGSDARKC